MFKILGIKRITTQDTASEIRSLTSLRFFASLWVVIFHFNANTASSFEFLDALINKGDLGVDLFFVLSGFVISYVYCGSYRSGTFDYLDFLVKRFARLYPIHLVTIIFYGVIFYGAFYVGLYPEKPSLADAVPNLLLVHAWGVKDATSWNYPSWSISAEWLAYLITPIFFWFLLLFRRNSLVMIAIAVSSIFLISQISEFLLGTALTSILPVNAAVRILPEFMLGSAMFLAYERYSFNAMVIRVLTIFFPFLLIVAIYNSVNDLVLILLFAALIFCLAQRERDPAFHILRWGPLRHGGEISYSIYMIHGIFQPVFFKLVEITGGYGENAVPIPFVVLGIILTIILSDITYKTVEVPGRRWLRRIKFAPRK